MWFSSLMKGFSSQSLIYALRSLTVHSPNYSTVASVRPHEQLLTKHGLSILSQLLGCSDIHHCYDQKAPEHYQRAWRGERFFPKMNEEKKPWAGCGSPSISLRFQTQSGDTWKIIEQWTTWFVSSWPLCCTVLKVPQIALDICMWYFALSTGILSLCYLKQ